MATRLNASHPRLRIPTHPNAYEESFKAWLFRLSWRFVGAIACFRSFQRRRDGRESKGDDAAIPTGLTMNHIRGFDRFRFAAVFRAAAIRTDYDTGLGPVRLRLVERGVAAKDLPKFTTQFMRSRGRQNAGQTQTPAEWVVQIQADGEAWWADVVNPMDIAYGVPAKVGLLTTAAHDRP